MFTNRPWARVAPLAIALALTAPLQACFGSFALTTKVYQFNRDVSSSFVVQEVVFLAFLIVPVYGVVGFVDAIILNTIEFFTGSNPVAMNERQSETIAMADGSTMTLTYTRKGVWIEQEHDGKRTRHLLKNDVTGMQLLDESGLLIGATRRLDGGGFELVDGEGTVLAAPGRQMLADLGDTWLRGGTQALVAEASELWRLEETRLAYAQ